MPRAPVVTDQIGQEVLRRVRAPDAYPDYTPGVSLPSAAKIGRDLGAHPATVGRALRALAKRGTVEYQPGKGYRVIAPPLVVLTQVSRPDVEDDETWRGFPGAARAAGREPYCDITRSAPAYATAGVAGWLGVAAGEEVFERARTQGIIENGVRVPYQLAGSSYTPALLADVPEIRDVLDVDPPPVRRRMLDAGRAIHYQHEIGVVAGTVEECRILGLPPGTWVLEVWRVCVETGPATRLEVTRIVADPAKVRYRY